MYLYVGGVGANAYISLKTKNKCFDKNLAFLGIYGIMN
jgi:hypothetical protein